jgi:hypothetical protein
MFWMFWDVLEFGEVGDSRTLTLNLRVIVMSTSP